MANFSTSPSEGAWIRVNGRRPCPVCKKFKGCLIRDDETAAVCLRVGSTKSVTWGLGGYHHELKPREDRKVEPILVPSGSARKASAKQLGAIYQALLDEHTLTEPHQQHLLEVRRLDLEAIRARGYKSWGSLPYQRAPIAQGIYERFGAITLDVPGLIVRKQKREYVTLAGAPGIAIPVRNVKSRIVGMQIRVDQPKFGKYLWLSSASQGGASPGTPVHVARPREGLEGSGRIWLTEGPLKADIACERLSEIVLALPGVNALRDFVPTLDELTQRGELKQLVIALDSDWHDKPAVAKARLLVAERAARAGVTVWLSDWAPEHKGLDDLLLAGGWPSFEPYQVQGNGPRPLEDAPALARQVRPPAIPLDEAREIQKKALKEFLWTQRDKGGEAERGRGILVRSLPGVGKSQALTTTLNEVLQKRSVRALVFVPRHELSQGEGREKWEVVRGRTHTSPALPDPPCHYGAVQARLSGLRIPGQLGCEHCPALELCQDLASGQGKPFYHAQFEKKAPITVHPLQHFLLPSLLREARIVALDDCDLRSLCIEDIKLARTSLEHALDWANRHTDHAYAYAQPLLDLLVHLVRQVPVGDFRWQEVEFFTVLENLSRQYLSLELETVLELAEKAQEPDPFGDQNLLLARLDVPMRFVRELVEVLRWEQERYKTRGQREWGGWNCRVRLERRAAGDDVELRLKLRRDLPLKALNGKDLVIVDASLTVEEAQQLFPDFDWSVIDPYVEMPDTVEIFQYPDQAWGKQRLQDERARQQALNLIGEVVARHPGESIAIITHKGFVGEVKQRFPQLIVGHFFGQRGSNQFKDCDVEIILGTPYPNPTELQQLAEALYWDEEPVLRQVSLEKRTFETAAHPRQVAVRCYADPRLRELQRSKCEEELLQAIYRIRPLSVEGRSDGQGYFDFGDGPRKRATVYLFSSMPLPGLRVQLVEEKRTRTPAPVVELRQAALAIATRGERITEVRLACESQASRYRARSFMNEEPMRSSLGAVGPPPAHGPPLTLAGCFS